MPGRRIALLIAAGVLAAGATAPAAGTTTPVQRAARYLVARQAADGSIGAVRSVHGVGEALASLVAAGVADEPVARALGFIARTGPGEAAERAGRAGLVVLGLVAAGKDPHGFAGADYVALIHDRYDAVTGQYDDTNLYSNALAALGLLAAGEQLPGQAERFMLAGECRDGGFGWRAACVGGPDPDTTAVVVVTLLRAGRARTDPVIRRARAYMTGAQRDDGGFSQGTNPTNANSTGLALSAIAAMGERPGAAPWRQADGDDPRAALLGLQTAGGGFRYSDAETAAGDFATVQALPGLAGLAHPIMPRDPPAPAPAPSSAASPREGARPPAVAAPSGTTGSPGRLPRDDPTPTRDRTAAVLGVRAAKTEGRTAGSSLAIALAVVAVSVAGGAVLRMRGTRT